MDIEKKVWEVLCSQEEIEKKVKELGQRISEDYQGKNLLVISLLKGSFIFTADLVRSITVPVKIAFMTLSSYGHDQSSTGSVKVLADINEDMTLYDVLIVDDIVDSGHTMKFVKDHLRAKQAKSIQSCVLLDKPSRRQAEVQADYVGFTIEDRFVVGYGLNFGDYYRNIPYVFAVTEEDR